MHRVQLCKMCRTLGTVLGADGPNMLARAHVIAKPQVKEVEKPRLIL